MNIIIAPSILSADFGCLIAECEKVLQAGADWLHVDIMDGHFVPNLTFGPGIVSSLRKHIPNVYLDCHLMVSNPFKWVQPFAKAGASSLTFHWESFADENTAIALINLIKSNNCKAAMAIKPATSVNEVINILPHLNMILVMTVEPGFGGQKLIEECLEKIPIIRKAFPDLLIQVDGGITEDNAIDAIRKGANILVTGTAIFKSNNVEKVMRKMKGC